MNCVPLPPSPLPLQDCSHSWAVWREWKGAWQSHAVRQTRRVLLTSVFFIYLHLFRFHFVSLRFFSLPCPALPFLPSLLFAGSCAHFLCHHWRNVWRSIGLSVCLSVDWLLLTLKVCLFVAVSFLFRFAVSPEKEPACVCHCVCLSWCVCVCEVYKYICIWGKARWGTVGHTACSFYLHVKWTYLLENFHSPSPPSSPTAFIDGTCCTVSVARLTSCCRLLLLLFLSLLCCCCEIAVPLAACQVRLLSVATVALLLLPPFPFLSIFCCAVRGDNWRSAAAYVSLSLSLTHLSVCPIRFALDSLTYLHTLTHTHSRTVA